MATMAVESSTPHARTNQAAAWRAIERRDAAYDGRFVYAVRSTGIYCRPSCASRRPLRANVELFDTPADAEAAGFRACLRCEPRRDADDRAIHRAVERARAYLERNSDRSVSLAELAEEVGLSTSHLQRSFKRVTGASPKQYQDARRAGRLKARLRAGDTVSRATYEAGYGSSSRVYERADQLLGMTPAAYRRGGAGVTIRYTIAGAPAGRVLVATTDRGVCAVELGDSDRAVEAALQADFPNARIERDDVAHADWVRAVVAHVADRRHRGAVAAPLDVHGTAFQREVWAALRAIPAGERRSYADIAAALGRPRAVRAVAAACAANTIAVVIPCHRVVRGNGALSGYKWGVERKRQLLDGEAD